MLDICVIAIAILIAAFIILIAKKVMLTRANRELLKKWRGPIGFESAWRNVDGDLVPCDPTNKLRGTSKAWKEADYDLTIRSSAESDEFWTLEGGDIAPSRDPIIESVELLPTGVTTGGQIYWRGAEIADNGKMYSIPYYGDNILITNTNDDTISLGPDVTGYAHPNSGSKWIDADLASNGKIWSIPQGAAGALVIDPSNDSISLAYGSGGPNTYEMNVRGTVCLDGRAYGASFTPATTSYYVRAYSIDSESSEGHASFEPTLRGPLFEGRPNYIAEGGIGRYLRMWGACDGENGKIYTVPSSADRIFIITTDPVLGNVSITEGVDYLTGNHDVPVGTGYIDSALYTVASSRPYLLKYSDMVKAPAHDACYAMPRCGNAILKINTLTDRAEEIPLPDDYPLDLDNAPGRSLGTVVGPDGRIWSVPWQQPYLIWIDPATDKIGWVDLSEQINLDNLGVSQNWFAYGRVAGNSIYFSPCAGSAVMKITIT